MFGKMSAHEIFDQVINLFLNALNRNAPVKKASMYMKKKLRLNLSLQLV